MAATIFTREERPFVAAVSSLGSGNPFLPERIAGEQQALGDEFAPGAPVWRLDSSKLDSNPNSAAIQRRAEAFLADVRRRLAGARRVGKEEAQLYEDLVHYVLYFRYEDLFFQEIVAPPLARGETRRMGFFRRFRDDLEHAFDLPDAGLPAAEDPAHLFALFFQVRRAFHHIFRYILGGSMAAARLRAAAWQSIFTQDSRRYRRGLYFRMHEISTLITGPSGTGKDLVATAIGLSTYIPFDPVSETFAEDFRGAHLALNLCALSPTLIESELFGHAKGSFTGATADRAGYLEGRGPAHSVFLDEIGELDPSLQVKLLRILQTREFQRIGEVRTRRFGGKIIAASNRDLATEVGEGRFRDDLYYRLCSDLIETPTLAEQMRDAPDELHNLLVLLARRVVAEEDAATVASEVEAWIATELGDDYGWPGNVRELEQCMRNVLVHGRYRPLDSRPGAEGPLDQLARQTCAGELNAEELLSRYCTLVYARTGRYEETARRLELDRRTVKRRIDPKLLAELRQAGVGRE